MRSAARAVEGLLLAIVGLAAICALAGFLIGRFAAGTSTLNGVGWGMCIGGALTGLLVGQSGSPSRMALEGRWGYFGHLWGRNAALPQSPLALALAAIVVLAGGIALFVLAG